MVFARRGVTIHFHRLNWLNYAKWCLLVSVHPRLVVVVVVDGLLCYHSLCFGSTEKMKIDSEK
jgi:hypothetical protein